MEDVVVLESVAAGRGNENSREPLLADGSGPRLPWNTDFVTFEEIVSGGFEILGWVGLTFEELSLDTLNAPERVEDGL